MAFSHTVPVNLQATEYQKSVYSGRNVKFSCSFLALFTGERLQRMRWLFSCLTLACLNLQVPFQNITLRGGGSHVSHASTLCNPYTFLPPSSLLSASAIFSVFEYQLNNGQRMQNDRDGICIATPHINLADRNFVHSQRSCVSAHMPKTWVPHLQESFFIYICKYVLSKI